jgi:hypothetical protein
MNDDDRFFKVAAAVWVVGALLSLGLVGVGVWAVVSLVSWLTGQ